MRLAPGRSRRRTLNLFRISARSFPTRKYSLASVYARIQRVPEAVELLQKVLQQEPEHFHANLLLGRIYTLQQRGDEALPYLKQAVTSEPGNSEAHAF